MAFVSLKYDDVFREVFSHENILKRFISDVTGISLEEICSVKISSPYLWRRYRKQKQGILDVALVLNNDIKVDIELQVRFQKHWDRRCVFYLSKLFTEDLRTGEKYERLRKCISISILDFEMTKGEACHSVDSLRDRRGREFTDLLEIHIIELTKPLTGTDALDDWVRLFCATSGEDLDMIKTNNAGVLEAINVMRTMGLGKLLRFEYEQRLKAKRDRWAEDDYIRDLGIKEGIAKGKAASILQLLEELGPVPQAVRDRVQAETDEQTLRQWLKSAADADSIQTFRQKENL